MADVFISYKSERRAAAEHLAEILTDHGYSVWWDYGLISGRDFGAQIEHELRAAKAVVVLWCSMAVESEWVREEAGLAKRLNKVIPTFIEKVELPLGFSLSQTLDLSEWDGAPQGNRLDRLLRDIGQFVGRAPKLNLEGLERTERAWRRFGAPSLREFALIDALERKLPPRTLPGGLGGRPASPPPPLPPPITPKQPKPGLVIAIAAAAIFAMVALALMYWGWGMGPPPDVSVGPVTEALPSAEPAPAATQPAATSVIAFTAAANPNIVAPGGITELAVFVTSGNAPVSNAQVTLASGGGIFQDTGTTMVIGMTDQSGVFRTRWSTNAPSAYTGDMSYSISVQVTKDGVEAARGEVVIFIRMQ